MSRPPSWWLKVWLCLLGWVSLGHAGLVEVSEYYVNNWIAISMQGWHILRNDDSLNGFRWIFIECIIKFLDNGTGCSINLYLLHFIKLQLNKFRWIWIRGFFLSNLFYEWSSMNVTSVASKNHHLEGHVYYL